MTNSTADSAQKKPRRQGPIRTEAVLPFALLALLTWAYFFFFFDAHLRRALEYGGTRAVGAEVNVGAVESSVWRASLSVRDIQITDAATPARNLVRIGELRWQMLWDALLRGKVVIDEAAIDGIQLGSPRARPGYVVPVAPAEPSAGPGYADTVLDNVQKEFSANVFGDLAALAQGADPGAQLSQITGQLQSQARLAELQAELGQKTTAWEQRIAALPGKDTAAALGERLRRVKRDNFKDVKELQSSVKELEAIRDEFDVQAAAVRDAGAALGSETRAVRTAYAEIDRLVQEDIRALKTRFRIPSLDARSLSNVLFGPELYAKVTDARRYMETARAYMPPKRSAEEKAARELRAPERGAGRNYAFGRPNTYPLFWLKQAQISSRSSSGDYAADLTGQITNVTSDPVIIGKPLVATITGHFPQQGWYDTRTELVIDHTTATPLERLSFTIGRYALTDYALVSSEAAKLGFAKAAGRSEFNAELRGQQVDIRLDNTFSGVEFAVAGSSDTMRKILTSAVAGADQVKVDARVSGSWSDIKWTLRTNLADLLEQGFRRHVQAKIEAAQARVQAQVNERIAAERRKFSDQLAAAEGSVRDRISARQAELDRLRADLDKAKADLEARKKALANEQEQKLKQESGKLLDSLKKKF